MRLSAQAAVDVTTPLGASVLQNDIVKVTGQNIGLNTIKRLTGVLSYEGKYRTSTLNILAEYLGFESWDHVQLNLRPQSSAIYNGNPCIDARLLEIDEALHITWQPNRAILVRHLGKGKYVVVRSRNSKLMEGDRISLSYIARNYPLVVSSIIRNGENLGDYVAGLQGGISARYDRRFIRKKSI